MTTERDLRNQLDYALNEGRELGRKLGREQGLAEGKEEAKSIIATNLLKAGVAIDIIAEATGLSIEECRLLESSTDSDRR